jgi:hypothetical protein
MARRPRSPFRAPIAPMAAARAAVAGDGAASVETRSAQRAGTDATGPHRAYGDLR